MKLPPRCTASLALAAWLFAAGARAFAADPPEPKFTAITLDDHIQIGYGLAIADVDGDGHPDILLADKKQFVWYRNPGPEKARDPSAWHKYLLAENLTEDDNVCIAAQDIDGDGKCEIAVGAAWKPSDTEKSGAVFYLIPPADRTQPWTPVKFPAVEPTTHRMRWVQLENGTWGLLVLPLHGRGNKDGAGAPVKVLLYHPPASLNDPKGEWRAEVVDESLHMTHNFDLPSGRRSRDIIVGGREGIRWMRRDGERGWNRVFGLYSQMGQGGESKGVGELRYSPVVRGQAGFIATIEPMHGNRLVVYHDRQASDAAAYDEGLVLTDRLVEGHALRVGNLWGNQGSQIVVGWRGKAGVADSPIGVAIWTAEDRNVAKWDEMVVDPNGMACEDLQLADLDGDGKLDIIAAGRRTHNVKIYFNETAHPQP